MWVLRVACLVFLNGSFRRYLCGKGTLTYTLCICRRQCLNASDRPRASAPSMSKLQTQAIVILAVILQKSTETLEGFLWKVKY